MANAEDASAVGSPYLQLHVAINLVPIFNGTSIPLESFIRTVERVKRSISPRDLPVFVTLVSAKIQGPAEGYISKGTPESLDKLFEELKRAYLPKTILSDVQTQIAHAVQKRNESVLDYGIRLERLVETACEASNNFYGAEQAAVLNRFIRETAARSFMKGLNNEIEPRVVSEKPKSLREAIEVATSVEKLLAERQLLEPLRNDVSSNQTQIRCNICNMPGHKPRHCPNRQPGTTLENTEQVNCNYCKKNGHTIENCRTKERESKYCTFCQHPGHTFDECFKKSSQNFQNSQNQQRFPSNSQQNQSYNRQQYNNSRGQSNHFDNRNNTQYHIDSNFQQNQSYAHPQYDNSYDQPINNESNDLQNSYEQQTPENAEFTVRIIKTAEVDANQYEIFKQETISQPIQNHSTHRQKILENSPPVIQIESPQILGRYGTLSIDTGADINLIKIGNIDPKTFVENTFSNRQLISGITEKSIETLGSLNLQFANTRHEFHLVNNSFPIKEDGILGAAFLRAEHAIISFKTNELISHNIGNIPFINKKSNNQCSNPEIPIPVMRVRYFDSTKIGTQISATNKCNLAHVNAKNPLKSAVEIITPAVTREDVSELATRKTASASMRTNVAAPRYHNNTRKQYFTQHNQAQPILQVHRQNYRDTRGNPKSHTFPHDRTNPKQYRIARNNYLKSSTRKGALNSSRNCWRSYKSERCHYNYNLRCQRQANSKRIDDTQATGYHTRTNNYFCSNFRPSSIPMNKYHARTSQQHVSYTSYLNRAPNLRMNQ
jgi:hypothetical protein